MEPVYLHGITTVNVITDMPQVVKQAVLSSHIAEAHGPGIISTYGLSEDKIAFFTAQDERDERGEKVPPINVLLLTRSDTLKDSQRITRALRLSYQFEILLYGTVMAANPVQPHSLVKGERNLLNLFWTYLIPIA